MKNPIAVLIYSLGHKSHIMARLPWLIKFNLIANLPFEHYCVFCAKYVDDDWWKTKKDFEKEGWFETLERFKRLEKQGCKKIEANGDVE
jgi:hypothetical protein